jgi:hypothetical protein
VIFGGGNHGIVFFGPVFLCPVRGLAGFVKDAGIGFCVFILAERVGGTQGQQGE